MTGKFIRRTLRNVVFPNKPYFSHLAITHRCNLKCRFCHVTEARFRELDTESTKRVIDVLDHIGVAVVSISGGGEPLLRHDFDQIIDYAASKDLYVKLTSNATMPRERYERLLKSRVDEIGISLDGVNGTDLPFSHIGPPILSTLRYLNDNLPPGKKLTINVTVSESNRGQVQEILDYCAVHFPHARVWLNPVVVGDGALRTDKVARTKPDYLRTCHCPTLLSANFYADGADRQYRETKFDWGCLAGDQFFDIKPNGDFWLCQDKPSPIPLNILDAEFAKKRARLDKTARHDCSGCLYSCYYLVQQSFHPKNWRDVALLWWKASTVPVGPSLPGFLRRAAAAALFLLLAVVSLSAGQTDPGISPAAILDRMEETGRWQRENLPGWHSVRTYIAVNRKLNKSAEVKVGFDSIPPSGEKTYCILERSGSTLLAKHAIQPILEAERQTSAPHMRGAVDINRRNYEFRFLQFDGPEDAYAFQAVPRFPQRYQFRGRVWIDRETYAIKRVMGAPAVPPSFWVKRTEFTHEYRRVGAFWLPAEHRSHAELRLFGSSTLEIDYGDYELTGSSAQQPRPHSCSALAERQAQWSFRLRPGRQR